MNNQKLENMLNLALNATPQERENKGVLFLQSYIE